MSVCVCSGQPDSEETSVLFVCLSLSNLLFLLVSVRFGFLKPGDTHKLKDFQLAQT